jgi:bifunctional oligoribonuclease and PAP phosphatase NrnA
MTDKVESLVKNAERVVIIQADNPDGDSLGSALALEEILGDMGKQVYLYCAVDIPDYLKHLKGWDRVGKEIPVQFDISFIVDTSAIVLLEKLEQSPQRSLVASKPVIVLDHHAGVKCDISYATIVINDNDAVATGEVIYKLAGELGWPLNLQAKTHIVSSILSDSLGLTSDGTSPQTYRIMADLIESGVDRPALEEARRSLNKMPEAIFRYKAKLIERTELHADGRLAIVDVTPNEIREFSPLYNPAPLVQNDLLQIEGVHIAIVLKVYKDGKITGAIRANYGSAIAAELAQHFGGGGHAYAAGFKITDGRVYSEIKTAVITKTTDLIATMKQDDETV